MLEYGNHLDNFPVRSKKWRLGPTLLGNVEKPIDQERFGINNKELHWKQPALIVYGSNGAHRSVSNLGHVSVKVHRVRAEVL